MRNLGWKSLAAVWLTCALTGCGAEMEQGAEPQLEKGPPPEERVQALASCSGPIALTPNVTVTGISANAGEYSCTYTLYVASANSNLTFSTSGGSGDVDLYVKYGSEPTTGSSTCSSAGSTSTESCTITGSQVGTYYVKLYGYSAFSGATLKATSTPSGPTGCTSSTTLTKDVPLNGIGATAGNWSCIYKLSVPTGATHVTFTTTGSGDADLFVRREASPTESVYDCRSNSYYSSYETCTLPVSSTGIYWARLYGTGDFSNVSITGTYTLSEGQPGCTTTSALNNNTPMYGVSAPSGAFSCDYTLDIPSGATSVTFSTTNGSGGTARLYAKRGSSPTLSSYDCLANTSGTNNQSCTLTNPTAGTWHVRVYNASSSTALTNASVRGAYVTGGTGNPGTGTLTNGVPVTGLSGAQGSYRYWTVTVPAGKTSLLVQTMFGTGDADLYVRLGSRPEDYVYDCRPLTSGNTESCLINAPTAGVYHVMIKGYTDYSGVTLKASY
ncbi:MULTISPECIES: PPC domain-containing protein [unclassified Corallococcus]|uniref:PPC domain-containing protein n=1 Tax=unclassified Corallococcus TaxID=2685029 RepID=UPI001A8E7C49|nr:MULTISPECIES: PPC domain-containing protein [unclassified Corallococcus]MBN9682703.1 PPC domain-containing protein [Corallococcus sp. NCSPR001]WAS85755.1 PPC domain-containing protein [Corallococcus sp. NCRR]